MAHHHRYNPPIQEYVSRWWRHLIVAQTTVVVLCVITPNFVLPGRPRIGPDSVVFAYSGWLWVETSNVPYLHLWDVKPPAIHETAALLSLLTGGTPWDIAVLSVILMSSLIIASTLLTGQLVYHHTSNPTAAYLAATVPLAYRPYYTLAATGLHAKHFTIFFGLLALYLCLVRDRWVVGGVAAGLAAGYWQFGLIFPLLLLLTATQRDRTQLKAVITGGLSATLLVVLPVVLSSTAAFSSMLVEVIGTSFLIVEPFDPATRLRKTLHYLSIALPVIGLGLAGAITAVLKRETAWITAGAGWFLIQVYRFDLDGLLDFIPLIFFAALGFGLLVDAVDEDLIPIYLVVGVVATGFGASMVTVATPLTSSPIPGSLDAMFWSEQVVEQCHVRMSGNEERFIEKIGEGFDVSECRYQAQDLIRG